MNEAYELMKEIELNNQISRKQKNYIKDVIDSDVIDSTELARMLASQGYTKSQMDEIRYGFSIFTKEQISLYADPAFNSDQMREIRYGFENGLSEEQVSVYADPKFNEYQMESMRQGFESGLSMEQVKFFADPRIHNMKWFVDRFQKDNELERNEEFER